MRLFCGFLVALAILSMAYLVLAQQDIHAMVKQQFGIENQLQITKIKLESIKRSREIFEGMNQAIEVVNVSDVSGLISIPSDELDNMKNMARENLLEVSLFQAELELRKSILEKSLILLRLNMTLNGYSPTPIKRFASNNYGTVYLTGNGTLLYLGKVGNSAGGQGYYSYVYDTTFEVLKYPTRVNTTILGDSIITGVYSTETNFVIKTSKNQLFTWGDNLNSNAGVGMSGKLITMKEISFGTSDPHVIKKVKCDVMSCTMLTEDGRLFYWGYTLSCVASSGICPGVTHPSTAYGQQSVIVPVQLKVFINGTERKVHDFATCSTSTYMNSICVILQVSRDIYCVGANNFGQLGEPNAASFITPTTTGASKSLIDYEKGWIRARVSGTFAKIFGGGQGNFYAIDLNGLVYSWGEESNSILGREVSVNKPRGVPFPIDTVVTTDICFSTSTTTTFALLVDSLGVVRVLGKYNGETFIKPYALELFKKKKIVDCDFSKNAILLLFEDGSTFAYGSNTNYQLLTDNTVNPSTTFVENTMDIF